MARAVRFATRWYSGQYGADASRATVRVVGAGGTTAFSDDMETNAGWTSAGTPGSPG